MSVLVTGGAGYIGGHMALGLADAGEKTVVVDNLSTDGTGELARRNGARTLTERKRVIAAVRNTGAAAAKLEYQTAPVFHWTLGLQVSPPSPV